MITSLTTALLRVTLFWYVLGALVLFIGSPEWAESAYERLMLYPWVPEIEMDGLFTAASVQWHLIVYWTLPVLVLWGVAIAVSYAITMGFSSIRAQARKNRLEPSGEFWGVVVPNTPQFKSLGALPMATTPKLVGVPVSLPGGNPHEGGAKVELQGQLLEAVKLLTAAERQLCEELLQLLYAAPDHFAGHGHGVGLLEHTLNVVTEAAVKANADFRLPLIAALAHDVGKLVTFQPDGKGGWKRRGLHSRESARILATLPGFQQLPELHRNALLLAVKYDHAPTKMPKLRGEHDSSMLAMRVINALSQADRSATAAEKDRNLEKLKPEDLLWQDFVNFLREAPIVQRGKKGAANQVNNPPDSPYLYIYEAPWRDAAIPRMPAEVAAALDLTRRDPGKLAKYTRILAERLRKEGLLVEEHGGQAVTEANPLWDIQSGTGEKAVVLRGILVLRADALWKAVNYRLSTKSPFPVQILAPNADADGAVNDAPKANRDTPKTPDVSDGLKLGDVSSTDAMAALGLMDAPAAAQAPEGGDQPVAEVAADQAPAPASAPKLKTRGRFKGGSPSKADDEMLGLAPSKKGGDKPAAAEEHAQPVAQNNEPAPSAESPEVPVVAEAPAPAAPAEDAPTDMELALASALGALHTPDPEPMVYEDEPGMMWEEPVDGMEPGEAPVAEEPQPEPVPEPQPKPEPVKPAAPAKAPEKAPAPQKPAQPQPAAPSESKADLSRAEKREGLALADEAACAKYPGLEIGDKYYTEHSRAVQAGLKKPGSRYKGDDKAKQLDLTSSGPRRAKRKPA